MANVAKDGGAEPPHELANVPPDITGETGRTRIIVKTIQDDISSIKTDIRDIAAYRNPDFKYILGVFAVGFVLLGAMLIYGYFRMDDKLTAMNNLSIRTDAKLEELLKRIPPIQMPAPRR